MYKNISLELNPFEAGLLMGVLVRESLNDKTFEPLAKRLCDMCQKEYYEDNSND